MFNSKDLWESIEVKLIELKNKNIDEILTQKVESLIVHFNGNLAKGTQFNVIDELNDLNSAINSPNFFKIRNIDNSVEIEVKKLFEELRTLNKILASERATYKVEADEVKERFPNIETDKCYKMYGGN